MPYVCCFIHPVKYTCFTHKSIQNIAYSYVYQITQQRGAPPFVDLMWPTHLGWPPTFDAYSILQYYVFLLLHLQLLPFDEMSNVPLFFHCVFAG